jgi:hypothetical protein
MMDESTILYLGASFAAVLVVALNYASYGAFGILMLALAILAILAILIINYADFIIFPAFTKILKINTIPAKDYLIPSSQNCILKYTKGLHYATGYLTANIYGYIFTAENVVAGEEEAMASAPDKWERMVMNINFPFKFNAISAAKDLQGYREELEAQRGLLSFQLSKELSGTNPSQMTVQELQRKINVMQTRIDRISGGERPITSLMYIESTAVGISEKEATDALANQLSQLQTLFNAFDLSISRVVGRELYYLHKFNYRTYDFAEINKFFQVQK